MNDHFLKPVYCRQSARKSRSFFLHTAIFFLCATALHQKLYAQNEENSWDAEQKKFFAPALSWVKSKLQPGEKIIDDSLYIYITHDAAQATEFNYKTEKLNRTVYIFSKKGETNDIAIAGTDTGYHGVDLPDNVIQKIQTAAYDIYKISFTGPIRYIAYALSLPHPKSLVENSGNLFSYLPDEQFKDSVISIRVIGTVRPDAKGWAANQKYFDEWSGNLAKQDAEISEERKKNDDAWTEFKTLADEIKDRFNTLYESAKKNNNKFYENRELSKQEVADAISEVAGDYYELNQYLAGKKTTLDKLAAKRTEYMDFFKEAVTASNKISGMLSEIHNEAKKANSENRLMYTKVITRNLYDIQLTASHIGSLSY